MSGKKILICAAATAITTLGLAQTGGAETGGGPAKVQNNAARLPNTGTVQPPSGTRGDIVVPWRGGNMDGTGVDATMPPRVPTPGSTAAPAVGGLPAPGTVEPRPGVNDNPGTGNIGNIGNTGTGPGTTVPALPNAASPGGPPVIGAPGGITGFQNHPVQSGVPNPTTPVTGQFGGPAAAANDFRNGPVNPGGTSQIDVTQRTQTPVAQPAGATLSPSTQPDRVIPLQPGQTPQPRLSIPMPPPAPTQR